MCMCYGGAGTQSCKKIYLPVVEAQGVYFVCVHAYVPICIFIRIVVCICIMEAWVHKDTRMSICKQWMQKVYGLYIMCIHTYEYICVSNMEARVHRDTRKFIRQQWMQQVHVCYLCKHMYVYICMYVYTYVQWRQTRYYDSIR